MKRPRAAASAALRAGPSPLPVPPRGDLPKPRVGAIEHGRIVFAVIGGQDHLDVVEGLGERASNRLADRPGGLETWDQNADGRC